VVAVSWRWIMPAKATGPRDATILCAPGRRLTKRISEAGVEGYQGAAAFEPEAVQVDGIEGWFDLLAYLAGRSDRCVIRGTLKPEYADRPRVLRRSRDRRGVAARFVELPRSWVMLDLEHLPNPGIDPTDPVLVGGAVRMHLPAPFRAASCVSQLSAQAGLEDGLRCHLWFMLDRPLARADLVRWFKPVSGVDLQVFVPVQPHYVASPLFEDVDDPCRERLALLPGLDVVVVPDLPDPRPRSTFSPAEQRPYAAPRRGIGFRSTRAERYMLKCLRAIVEALPGRRHPTIVGVAVRLFGLAKAGDLDPGDVAARLKGAVALGTFDRSPDEVNSALRWAWEHSEPWRLP
jgi:hypothetical protein